MEAPIVVKTIPSLAINERASYGPFDLKNFIKAPDGSALQFTAELTNGQSLPKGMICTSDGILTGIPAKDTQGNYEVKITAHNEAGSVQTEFVMVIKPSLATSETQYFDKLKAQVWEALEQNLPIPDLGEMFDRPVTPMDIYYLLERWGILTIWDAFNLDPPGEKQALTLKGASKHYHIYDRGSCLVASPKDLFSHERTVEDGLMTARAMAGEVYKRNWTIEMAGFDKLARAAWIELQHLGDLHGKRLAIINYKPSIHDVKLYAAQSLEEGIKGKLE